ncbi:MAG: S-layer homology domain-containing protein [Clostridiales bacterium]|nr:S-layer homology domain-containing protein [Clostridiales bacterium]
MLKKLFPNIIIITLLAIIIIQPIKAESKFTDIEEKSWYGSYVEDLVQMGIINGFPDGTFRSSDTLNADQFIKMVVTALGENPGNGTNYWASSYIECAVEKGLLDYNKIIDYKKPLPRGEIVCIISKALDILNENIEIEACGLYDLYGFTPDCYVPYVLKTYNAGIVTGYPDKTFRYEKYINRAEACAVIHKLVTPITRREHQITSFTPVPVCYSYIEEKFTTAINEYEGNKSCFVAHGNVLGEGVSLSTDFNADINTNVIESMKLLYDNITYPVFEFNALSQNNVVRMDLFQNQKLSHNKNYAMFTLKYFDAPTGYSETQWGYDSMFMKLEINRLSLDGLLNKETGMPDVYYEYKIRALMRLLFGIERGDIFAQFILDNYIEYSDYDAGNIPKTSKLLSFGGIKVVFFCEGNNRQLCFTFSED